MIRRIGGAALGAAVVAGWLALPPVPWAWADHGTEGARDIADGCPPEQVPSNGFEDLDEWDPGFVEAIDCIVAYAISHGVSTTQYAPSVGVPREQMASFLIRVLDNVDGYSRPSDAPDGFSDDSDSVHHDNINAAAAEQIATGFPDGTFRPRVQVTRAQMASFVARTLTKAGASLPVESPDAFPDDGGNTHEPAINALADVHVVVGDTVGNYGPNRPVTRAQMALFLARSLDYLVAEERLTPPFDPNAPRDVVASPLSTTAIRVTWLPPTQGDPDSFNIYRITAPGGGDCPLTGYQKVGSVSAATGGGLHYDDAGLTPGVTYCYRVTAVEGDRESGFSTLSTKAKATTAVGAQMVSALVDTEMEIVTITYGESVSCAAASVSQFSFAGASPATPSGISCGGTTVVVLTFTNASGAGDLTYRQSVDQPGIRLKNDKGQYAISPQTITVIDAPPKIESAEANTTADTVVITYSEPVSCLGGSWGQFSYTFPVGDNSNTATFDAISGCADGSGNPTPSRVVTLAVKDDSLLGSDFEAGTLRYSQAAEVTQRIVDEGGNHAVSPDSMADKVPRMISAVADTIATTTDQVVVVFNQDVTCVNGAGGAPQFEYDGVQATAIAGCATVPRNTITLRFGDGSGITGDGKLIYTQGVEADRVKDLAGRDAENGHFVNADARPVMVSSEVDTSSQRLLVTYSEPINCVVAGKTQFKYNTSVDPQWIQCSGTNSTLTVQLTDLGTPTSLRYTQSATDPSIRVKDLAGNDASTPQTLSLSSS